MPALTLAIAVSVLFLVAAGRPTSGAARGPVPPTSLAPLATVAGPPPSTHPIQHVVVIYLENEGVSAVNQFGPYERYLGTTYGNVTQMYGACHPSMSNYIAAVAAVTPNCGSDSWYNYSSTSLGDLLGTDPAHHFTWAQFAESLPSGACATPYMNTGTYAVRHVPFLYFQNVTKSQSYCTSHVLNSAYFNGTVGNVGVTSSAFVNFSFYTPNTCNDGHYLCGALPAKCASISGSQTACQEVTQADSWLQGFLGPMLNSTNPVEANNVNHTMFIVTWDESGNPQTYAGYSVPGITAGNNYAFCGQNNAVGDAVCGGQVYGLVIDHYNRGVAPMSQPDAAYGIAATVEWLFGLGGPHGTGLDNPGQYDYLYRSTSPGFPTFASVSGISGNGYGTTYPVTFTESGLPTGTRWYLNVTGATPVTSTSTIATIDLPNGTYAYAIGSANPTFGAFPESGSVQVSGTAVSEAVTFTSSLYPVTFTESGLPTGTRWYLNVTGATPVTSTSTIATIDLPNGTYAYAIGSANPTFGAFPESGSVQVSGTAVSEAVTFTSSLYPVTFTESGLPTGTRWYLNVTGSPSISSTSTNATVHLQNGTFHSTIATTNKEYAPTPDSVSFEVMGTILSEPVAFSPVVYPLTFTEVGLPAGTNWSVTLNGSPRAVIIGTPNSGSSLTRWSSGRAAVEFNVTNGSYTYSVSAASYSSPGSIVRATGQGPVSMSLTFSKSPGSSSQGLSPLEYGIIGGVLIAGTVSMVAFLRRRSGKATRAPAANGTRPGAGPPPEHR